MENRCGLPGLKVWGGEQMAFSRDEKIKDLVSMIEDPEEGSMVGTDEFDEMELYDMELGEPEEELYEEEDGAEVS